MKRERKAFGRQFRSEPFSEKKTRFSFRRADAAKRKGMHACMLSEDAQPAAARVKHQERRVDALALRAEERRDKLRKAAGRSTYPMIRRCLNGETHYGRSIVPYGKYIAIRREPGELKHLSSRRRRKKTRFPK